MKEIKKKTLRQKIEEANMDISLFLDRHIGGHIQIGNVTIFGHNAMHFGVEIYTWKYGYICFRLPLPCYGWRKLYFYCSPNGTPWASTFYLGPRYEERKLSRIRREKLGHNFDTECFSTDLDKINGYTEDSES